MLDSVKKFDGLIVLQFSVAFVGFKKISVVAVVAESESIANVFGEFNVKNASLDVMLAKVGNNGRVFGEVNFIFSNKSANGVKNCIVGAIDRINN